MRRNMIQFILLACALPAYSLGATMPVNFSLPSDLNDVVHLVAVTPNNAQQISPDVNAISGGLPAGSFVLFNKRDVPIMSIVVSWQYTYADNTYTTTNFTCDGYLRLPAKPIVSSHGSALVTATGCTKDEFYPNLRSGHYIGNPLMMSHQQKQPTSPVTEAVVKIDSIIYSDGKIAGLDTRNYYKDVQLRSQAMRNVANMVSAQSNSPEELKTQLTSISISSSKSRDRETQMQFHWANTLQKSPNLPNTLALIHEEPELPQFSHMNQGGAK